MLNRNIQIGRRLLQKIGALALAGIIISSCGEVTGPAESFLLRYPMDVINHMDGPIVAFSKGDTRTLDFEWEAAVGAESYEIVLWKAVEKDSMYEHIVNFDDPALSFEIQSPEVVKASYNPEDPNERRELSVVQYEQPLGELADIMESRGYASDEDHYFIWSVFAEGKGKRWKSPENQRLTLRWNP